MSKVVNTVHSVRCQLTAKLGSNHSHSLAYATGHLLSGDFCFPLRSNDKRGSRAFLVIQFSSFLFLFLFYLHGQDAQLNAASPILRLTRSGETAWGPLPGGDWTIFQANHSTYEPLAWAHRDSLDYPTNKSPLATVIQVYLYIFIYNIYFITFPVSSYSLLHSTFVTHVHRSRCHVNLIDRSKHRLSFTSSKT